MPPSRVWARAVDQTLALELGLQPFRPRRHWFNGDLQTLRDTLRKVRLGPDQGEPITVAVGGGDQLLAMYDPPLPMGRTPLALVLLLHGLGGGSEREGLRRLGQTLQHAGFAVLRLNLRGAGPGRPLARGTYAARCNRDLRPVLARARQLADRVAPGGRPLLGVGLSLGGTLLLNVLLAADGSPVLDGLVCISSPPRPGRLFPPDRAAPQSPLPTLAAAPVVGPDPGGSLRGEPGGAGVAGGPRTAGAPAQPAGL